MPVQPPRRDLIDNHALCATQLSQSRDRRVDELPQRSRQMAAMIAFEDAPLMLLRIEMRTVAGQGEDLQPFAPCCQRPPRRIWFVSELPRTALGKVQRGELRRLWLEQHSSGDGLR